MRHIQYPADSTQNEQRAQHHNKQQTTAIQIDRVSKSYDQVQTVQDISLTVTPGQFVSIVGPSGCGKSTLLRMIAGLDSPTAGRITLFGETPAVARRKQRTVSYVFQEPTLLPWRSVLDNVALPLELMDIEKQERQEQARRAVRAMKLEHTTALHPDQLSGGMKMRVSIARAMCTEPKVLLMDEPFAAIDEITRKQFNEDLHALWYDQQFTVLFVTHNIYEALFLSTHIVVLSSKPAHIADIVTIDSDTPRDDAFRESREFAKLASHIWHLLEAGSPGYA